MPRTPAKSGVLQKCSHCAVADEKYSNHCFFSSQIALKCRILQGLSAFQGIVVFFSFTTFFAKKCKMKQITSVCSSQIVVSLGSADYCSNKFPNLINLLISLKCSTKIFLHFNHLTALHKHPYPIL